MKKALIISVLAFNFSLSSAYAWTSCYATCSYNHCKKSEDNWNECFNRCIQEPKKIKKCIQAAQEMRDSGDEKYISQEQKAKLVELQLWTGGQLKQGSGY